MSDPVLVKLLNQTATVLRVSRTADDQGGWTESWTEAGSVAVRARPLRATEQVSAEQLQGRVGYVVYVGATADIRRGDRLLCAGHVLEVRAVREPSLAGHHLEVDCVEVIR